jgi:hypothetical protein
MHLKAFSMVVFGVAPVASILNQPRGPAADVYSRETLHGSVIYPRRLD